MFKERKTQLTELESVKRKLEDEKKITIDMLEERRKKDEETHLQPILQDIDEVETHITLIKQSIIKGICDDLDMFSKSPEDLEELPKDLLERIEQIKCFDKELYQKVTKKMQCLFEHFLSREDVDSCMTLLKLRTEKEYAYYFDKDRFDKSKDAYAQMVKDFPPPQYTDGSKYIMSYGEYRKDILRLMELCGRLDARVSKEGEVYYSAKSKEAIISGAVGEFGCLVTYLYSDGEFGHWERDRETLMYWHQEGYKAEQEKLFKQEGLKQEGTGKMV